MNVMDIIENAMDADQRKSFRNNLNKGQRIGQSYFNSLDETSRNTLRETVFDPFYHDDATSVMKAMEFLSRV